MKRYIVTKIHIAFGYVTEYSFTEKEHAEKKMAQLDADVRYTYTYEEKEL